MKELIGNPTGTIILCEEDERIIHAANNLFQNTNITPLMVGNTERYQQMGLNPEIQVREIKPEKYLKRYQELRSKHAPTNEEAHNELMHPAQYSAMIVDAGDADGLVCGATWPTADTLRAALRTLRGELAYSFFIMNTTKGTYLFGDCAFNVQPNSEQLAQIAYGIGLHAEKLEISPRIAMLSFSTAGSANHPDQEKVALATRILNEHIMQEGKTWSVGGEFQVDAAMDEDIRAHKAPGNTLQGNANIFIFPDLDAGNIGYKLVQRFTDCEAIGPIIGGLKKPVNDLSRGCTTEEIVQVCQFTAWQSQHSL